MMKIATPISLVNIRPTDSFQTSPSECGIDSQVKDFSQDKLLFSTAASSPKRLEDLDVTNLEQSADLNSYNSDSETETQHVLRSCFRLVKDVAKKRFENSHLLQEKGYDVSDQTTLYQVQFTDHPEESSLNQALIAGQYRIQWLVQNFIKEAVGGKAIRLTFGSDVVELSFSEKN